MRPTGREGFCPRRGEFPTFLLAYRKDEKFRSTVENKMPLYEAISSSTAFLPVSVAIMLFITGGDMRQAPDNSVICLLAGPVCGVFMMRGVSVQYFIYLAELALDNKNKTVIVVARRMRTIRGADKIVLLNQGKIEAMGTDAELHAQSVTCRKMLEKSMG